jgi:hypothetical protein
MKLKDKKIVFAGCSFTYGHGLWHKDLHPGLEWQRIVASSIIKKLETDLS